MYSKWEKVATVVLGSAAALVVIGAMASVLATPDWNWETPVSAQTSTSQIHDAFAYEAITVAATAIGFTNGTLSPAKAPSAKAAFCTLETAEVRYRYDGTNPSSSEGHLLASGGSITLYGINNLNQFRAIRTTGSSGTLRCTYMR